ncbi:hypothetical protein HJC23_002354 [Cyclotella cryptica]|uniref:SMP-30/Gluconolactonase/LRE-like region domain-containing protein n=1 Tax=Cyclotella cryptica TaxID=29204 RepID=A0ABD3QMA1_9STRA
MINPGGNPNSPMPDFATGPSVLCNRPDQMSTKVDSFYQYFLYDRSDLCFCRPSRAGATTGENNAGLFRLNSSTLQWEEILDYRFRVSNCICFSPDCKTMYFGDTPTRAVYAFDYSPDGPLTNRRLVWTMPSDMPGGPDGAQIDSNGNLWIAVTGANRVVQLDPSNGQIEMIVHLDANPTSLTFGGPELDELFITTRAPNGGGLYRVKMPYGVKGLPEPEFRLGTPYV